MDGTAITEPHNALIKPAATVNAAIGTDVAAARFQSIVMRLEVIVMELATYFFGACILIHAGLNFLRSWMWYKRSA